jgi:hypothetical protein
VDLDPTQPVYLSNRSAALFELSRYKACMDDATRALDLLEAQAGDQDGGGLATKSDLYAKLTRRAARATLCLGRSLEGLLPRMVKVCNGVDSPLYRCLARCDWD